MTLRRLSILQWFGVLGAAVALGAEFLAATGLSQAACNPGSARWGIPHDALQAVLTAVGAAVVLAAEGAAFAVFRATRNVDEQAPPPQGRMHFFATAALAANAIFLMIILITGIATIVDPLCRQS
jgi:hypothetical protein